MLSEDEETEQPWSWSSLCLAMPQFMKMSLQEPVC